MNNLDAFICLNLLSGIGPVKVKSLIEVFGSAREIFNQSFNSLNSVDGIGPKLASAICDGPAHSNPEEERALAEKAGAKIISQTCPEYPPLLKEIVDPPLVLYVRGNADVLQDGHRSIAMVGSRHPSRYGIHMAETIACSAAAAEWITVSGLALGVDSASHRATIEAGGKTIAVLGSGLGRLYPQENLKLARDIIASGGAVISEFPMTFPPDRRSFPMRNRIISGLCCSAVVVEAGLKSGTLITAGQAADQGRTVCAVPGRADTPHSRGCHSLIRDGATILESFSDVLEDCNSLMLFDMNSKNGFSALSQKKVASPVTAGLQLTETEQRILQLLSLGDASVDHLIDELQLAVGKVFSTLVEMETKKLVKPLPGRHYTLWA